MVEVYKRNDYYVAKIKYPEANLESAAKFKESIISFADKGYKFIIVDFSDVVYIDSTYLSALVSTLKYAISKDGDIALTGLNKDLYNLFLMVRLDKVFLIYDELPESFSGSSLRKK
ncbi:STAS domain-containing protein [Arcticibacter tournemirensis]|uniref:Anti-sigma factor antagonist n=1 Tax=Arcticibacter tournemirensis TaxID=699437 RepID=A0A4Q0MG68_9SPHI|nr:STAS domain-containing protein [Arcticibacter tournemirensis]RXF72551.1 anti-sigma factor antagonist [Arcticibacter tournemirensis]